MRYHSTIKACSWIQTPGKRIIAPNSLAQDLQGHGPMQCRSCPSLHLDVVPHEVPESSTVTAYLNTWFWRLVNSCAARCGLTGMSRSLVMELDCTAIWNSLRSRPNGELTDSKYQSIRNSVAIPTVLTWRSCWKCGSPCRLWYGQSWIGSDSETSYSRVQKVLTPPPALPIRPFLIKTCLLRCF